MGSDVWLLCSDGVGRTGAFIATHAEMERMKAESVVDLFQFIKAVRIQRAGLVSNKARNRMPCLFYFIILLYRSSMSFVI